MSAERGRIIVQMIPSETGLMIIAILILGSFVAAVVSLNAFLREIESMIIKTFGGE